MISNGFLSFVFNSVRKSYTTYRKENLFCTILACILELTSCATCKIMTFTTHAHASFSSYSWQMILQGFWSTRTRVNSYPFWSTRPQVNSYPSQLVPKSNRTLFETWLLWVSLLLNTFIYSSLLPSTSAASCQWKKKSFQTQMRRRITQRLISVIDVILKKRQLLFKLWQLPLTTSDTPKTSNGLPLKHQMGFLV